MYEFDSLSVSADDASSLAAQLTEKSNDGWDVVAIVPAGSSITAYLKRSGSSSRAADTSTSDASSAYSTGGADSSASSTAPSEPAGWGSAPEAGAATSSWGSQSTPSDSGSSWGSQSSSGSSDSGSSWGPQQSAGGGAAGGWGSTGSTSPTAPASSTPSVPAGWYADPANRYELRYWDGSAWTEHVSRAGQQYTDPPVA